MIEQFELLQLASALLQQVLINHLNVTILIRISDFIEFRGKKYQHFFYSFSLWKRFISPFIIIQSLTHLLISLLQCSRYFHDTKFK